MPSTGQAWSMFFFIILYIYHTFLILYSVKFNSEASMQEEWWIGKIIELRLKQDAVDASGAWAKVRWYYSAKDIKDIENPPEDL